jgi:hypothetical protein
MLDKVEALVLVPINAAKVPKVLPELVTALVTESCGIENFDEIRLVSKLVFVVLPPRIDERVVDAVALVSELDSAVPVPSVPVRYSTMRFCNTAETTFCVVELAVDAQPLNDIGATNAKLKNNVPNTFFIPLNI